MALWGLENLVFGNVSGAFGTGDTTLNMASGHTARFTIFPCRAVLWNAEDHASAHEAFWAGDAEVITIESKAGDTFDSVIRGEEGTSAISSDGSKVYRVAVALTAGQLDKICRAEPDATGPYDAVLTGTAIALTGAVARFVNRATANDNCLIGLQGGTNSGAEAGFVFGNPANNDYIKFDAGQKRLDIALDPVGVIARLGQNGSGNGWGFPWAGSILYNNHFKDQLGISDGNLIFGINTQQVISSGAISVSGNGPVVVVDTEGAAGTDDLDMLNGGTQGEIVLLRAFDNARTVVVKHGTGNMHLVGDADFSMTTSNSIICLWKRNASTFYELFRADHP